MAGPIRKLLLLASCALLWCGSALAAPPTEPPGKSGSAPGHQKHEGEVLEAPAPEPVVAAPEAGEELNAKEAEKEPPRQAEKPDKPEQAKRHSEAAPRKSGEQHEPAPARGPAAPVTPPATSISAPGSSGPHKATICHNGHAITVDLHGARTHVGRHGDTYAPAGAKGRAACAAQVRDDDAPAPPKRNDPATGGVATPTTTADPAASAVDVSVSNDTARPDGVRVTAAARPTPARGTPAHAGAVNVPHATVRHATLPFTGRSLLTIVLLALGLIGLGALLRGTHRSLP